VDAVEETVSADRDTRRRLELVQTRLREIEAELAITESPGHAEKVAELQKLVRDAKKAATEADDRLAFVRTDLAHARRDVEELHLAVQRKQTKHVPELFGFFLGAAGVFGAFQLIVRQLQSHTLTPALATAVSVGSALVLGVVVRARAVPPDTRRSA
jgi:hypothetical protein